jgi:hypothetical protein
MQTVTEKISKIRILKERDLGEITPYQIIDEKGRLAQDYNVTGYDITSSLDKIERYYFQILPAFRTR